MSETSIKPTVTDDLAARGPRRTPVGESALVLGALALAVGRFLSTNGGSPEQRLRDMGGHDVQVTASALLAIAGFVLLVPGFNAVAAHVHARGQRLAAVGTTLVLVGAVAFSILAAVDLPTLAATHVRPTTPMIDYLGELDVSPGILAITPFAVIGYFFGPFLTTLAARREGLVSRWLPWGVLAALVLQPLGVALGGPRLAHVVDTVCQLGLVALCIVLVRSLRRADQASVQARSSVTAGA